MFNIVFYLTILIGLSALLLSLSKRPFLLRARRAVLEAVPTEMTLSELLRVRKTRRVQSRKLLLQEQTVRSLGHRYTGRFDAAVISMGEAPIAHVVIERKFPANQLPAKARPEDIFQLGLYALALMETGVSCESTLLMVIYCLQDRAQRCLHDSPRLTCAACGDARIFVSRFRQRGVEKTLRRLDEVWYSQRPPRPASMVDSCRICPYGTKGVCNFVAS